MTRELKFRVWDTDKSIFVPYGEIVVSLYGDANIEVVPNCEEYIGDSCHDYHKDSRFIISQYTGLSDKNGVETYEGDIIRVTEEDEDSSLGNEFEFTAPVCYGNGDNLTSYRAQYPTSFCLIHKRFYMEQSLLHDNRWDYEVIGNIYENKELLND